MKNLIILCGCGSCGKSTYAEKISKRYTINYYDVHATFNYKLMRYNVIKEDLLFRVKCELLNNNSVIFAEFANDSIRGRQSVLNNLVGSLNDTNLIIIELRPGVEYIDKRNKLRGVTNIDIKTIKSVYYHYQFTCKEEFISYGFNSVNIFTVDNSDDISKLDISYLDKFFTKDK